MIQSCLMPSETLTRKTQTNFGSYDNDGFATDPEVTTENFTGNVQPVSGFQLLQLSEGDRTRQPLFVYTDKLLEHKDIIERKGIDYEVQTVEIWDQPQTSLCHFKVTMTRVYIEILVSRSK